MGNIYIEDITTSLPNFKCKQCKIILFLTNTILSNIINFGSLNKFCATYIFQDQEVVQYLNLQNFYQ